MKKFDLVIKNGTVVTASDMFSADLGVKDGKIAAIAENIEADAEEVFDAAGKLVLPGALDVHTHLAMPFGGTISSDSYLSGTRAAACGGVTTASSISSMIAPSERSVIQQWDAKSTHASFSKTAFFSAMTPRMVSPVC